MQRLGRRRAAGLSSKGTGRAVLMLWFFACCVSSDMPNHHTLKAWQHAEKLAVECSLAAQGFPDFEQNRLADQLRRASYSIPLNIAEGSARKGTRDYRKFLDTAWGSLAEVQTALVMARDIGYLRAAEFGRLEALATETSKTLFGLLRKISQPADRPKSR